MKLKSLLLKTTVFTKMAIAVFFVSPANAVSIYTIGNSLTYDTLPFDLEGNVGYHIGCSKNLQQIYADPQNSACVTPNMGTWDEALTKNQFDIVTVQPFVGTTLEQDLAIINRWMKAQPKATFVIHTGWSSKTEFEADTHNVNDETIKSLSYYSELLDSLATDNPKRNIVSTQALTVLDSIYHDIEDGIAPFSSFSELFRDNIHMDVVVGRYLMHNLMRQALGQSLDNPVGLESGEIKAYLDAKILEHKTEQFSAKFSYRSALLILGLSLIVGMIIVLTRQRYFAIEQDKD